MQSCTKNIIFILVVLCLITNDVWAASGRRMHPPQKFRVNEPSLSEILEQYYQREGLGLSHIAQWMRRIKKAAYLPTLYLGYDHAIKENQGFSITDNTSISSGVVTLGPEDNDYDYDSNLGRTIRARAVWKLDETVFNRNYFELSRERRDVVKIRFETGQKITKIYEQRQAVLIKYLHPAHFKGAKAAIAYAQYLVLTEELDALTGGVYHQRWWKKEGL
ncbi:MAG: hypothetical protein HQM16_12655 [Deltaproteobacteria bacterium]|nr:hypothetical protein [Deltaproteobacteria bacterium]